MSPREQALELRQNRVKLVHDARVITDKAIAEKRELSPEEKAQWDKIMADVDALKARVDQLEGQAGADEMAGDDQEMLDSRPEQIVDEERASARFGRPAVRSRASGSVATQRYPWESELQHRNRSRRSRPEYRAAFVSYLLNGEKALHSGIAARAIQADNDLAGGYLVAPQEFLGKLIKFVDDAVYIRSRATKYTVSAAQSLGAPSLDTDISDADWTSELATGNEDTAMAFGKRELHPHPLAKRIKVSNKLLRAATISGVVSADGAGVTGGPEALVRDRLAYKFAVSEEKGFLTGSGAQRPLGLYTASTRGISTGRDIVTGTATDFTADGLMDVKYGVKAQYQATGEWLVHRDGLKRIRKLKDGVGQYLWGPGLNGGEPDTLLDRPVIVSEFNPNTFTTGQYVILFGDYSFYWIADADTMVIQKLLELYAESNQTGFIARMELDGMPVLEEAFARGKLA